MNNLKKLIIKFIVLVILISSSLLFMTGKVNAAATRNYNFNATNILDNLSKDPKFGLIIPVISTDNTVARRNGVITANKVRSDFQAKGLTVKTISTGNVIGTGTVITVNENSNKYPIISKSIQIVDGEILNSWNDYIKNIEETEDEILMKKYMAFSYKYICDN